VCEYGDYKRMINFQWSEKSVLIVIILIFVVMILISLGVIILGYT